MIEAEHVARRNGGQAARLRGHRRCVDFFFQAEDGIRDGRVTGVQTCALPISHHTHVSAGPAAPAAAYCATFSCWTSVPLRTRSEERRVGKECRSRWWRYF